MINIGQKFKTIGLFPLSNCWGNWTSFQEATIYSLGFTGRLLLLITLVMFSLASILYFFSLVMVWTSSNHWLVSPHLQCFHLELTTKIIFWLVKIIYKLVKNWHCYFSIFFHLWLLIIALAYNFCQICFSNRTDVWHRAVSLPDASDPVCRCSSINEILDISFLYPPV